MGRPLNLDVVGTPLEATTWSYCWKDCALYALGVGEADLRYTWEGHPHFAVLPGFAVVPSMPAVMIALAKVGADLRTLVHGAQTVTLEAPLPRAATLTTEAVISEVQDKGKGAVVIIDTHTRAEGALLFSTQWSIFCRGQGGFGGPRGASAPLPEAAADATPAFEAILPIREDQALLYRLSGDLNPLHVDPELATAVGFERPILHGLCTYGFALRAAIAALAAGEAARVRRFQARFSGVVYPGEDLTVRALPAEADAGAEVYRLEAVVGDRAVLSQGVLELRRAP